MYRLALLLSVVACTEPGSADAFRDRNPAMRITDYGYVHDLTAPSGWLDVVVGEDRLFALDTQDGCTTAYVYTREKVRAGVRSHTQTYRNCEDDELVSYGDGVGLFGREIYRRSPRGMEFTENIPLRADLTLLDHAVIDSDTLAYLVEGTLYLFEHDGTQWVEADRLPAEGDTVVSDGEHLVVGQQPYAHDGTTWQPLPQTLSWPPLGVLDGRAVTHGATASRNYIIPVDEPTSVTAAGGRAGLTAFGHIEIDQLARERRVYDLDGRLLSRDDVHYSTQITSGEGSVASWSYSGRNSTLVWIEATDGRPPGDLLLDQPASLARGEWARHTFEVPPGVDTLTVRITGSGDADLYVGNADEPTLSTYDCSPYRAGSDEVCEFLHPAEGRWHVGIHGYDERSDVVVNAIVE